LAPAPCPLFLALVSRKVTKRHGEQGKLRTLMNRRGAVENPVRKTPVTTKKYLKEIRTTPALWQV